MPITSAVPPGVTPTTNPSGLPGATGSIGSTGSTGATTFGDAMREVEASRATATGAVDAPTSAKVVVTQLEDAKVAERIDQLVDTASAARSPSARERLLSALSDLGTQYEELLADVEGMDGAKTVAPGGVAGPHPGVDPAADTSPHRIAAEPSSSTGETSFDADTQFADWRSEQKELLTLQIRAHRLMHSVEVVSKTVEQSVSGMKTVFQTQV